MYIKDSKIVVEVKTDFTMKDIAEKVGQSVIDKILDVLNDEIFNKSNDAIQDAWDDFDGADNAQLCIAVLEELTDMIEEDAERWFD